MDHVDVWYATDNEHGGKIASSLKTLGLTVNVRSDLAVGSVKIDSEQLNVYIYDLEKTSFTKIISEINNDSRLNSSLKFVILPKADIKDAIHASMNIMQIEFIARPVLGREFVLLIEKSILVERYREIMKNVSNKYSSRVENMESLMNIARKDVFVSPKETEVFQKIIEFEKNLVEEQDRLNMAIKEFAYLRHHDLFEIKTRLEAEEMLTDLRHKELLVANDTIKAQESVLNFSSKELSDAKKILDASTKVAELGREEAIELHGQIKILQDELAELAEENSKLKKRIIEFERKS